jgi:hypothetical protein
MDGDTAGVTQPEGVLGWAVERALQPIVGPGVAVRPRYREQKGPRFDRASVDDFVVARLRRPADFL